MTAVTAVSSTEIRFFRLRLMTTVRQLQLDWTTGERFSKRMEGSGTILILKCSESSPHFRAVA